jgi:WD40 repeat protein
VDAIAIDADGRYVAAGGRNRQVIVWDTSSKDIVFRTGALVSDVRSLTFSADAKAIVVGTGNFNGGQEQRGAVYVVSMPKQ